MSTVLAIRRTQSQHCCAFGTVSNSAIYIQAKNVAIYNRSLVLFMAN